MKWKISILGTRGSAPITGRDFEEYGGDTLCVAVECEDRLFVFDAGTGIRHLKCSGKETHIFISHYHQDHILGLGKWPELLNPENRIILHLPDIRPGERGIDVLSSFFSPPFWPVGLHQYPAEVLLVTMGETCDVGDLHIAGISGCHPDGVRFYRLYDEKRSFTYMVDCELPEDSYVYEQFARNSDLLIIDGQMDETDLPMKKGWGHNTMLQAGEFGKRCLAKKTILVHVDVDADDGMISERRSRLQSYYPTADFGKQGEAIRL
ncbi:MAG: MBL fold metallo-hydrolase [Acetatifactor sp.]|nr:MBL fold metallo-hydrolase [Acetatifactor sp.]